MPSPLTSEDGPGTVRLQAATGRALVVAAGAVTVSGLTVRSAGEEPAVAVSGGRLDVVQCTVEAAAWTALHVGAGELALRDCEVNNASGAGIVVSSPHGAVVDSTRLHGIGSTALVATGDGVLPVRNCAVGPCGGNGVFVSGAAAATIVTSTICARGHGDVWDDITGTDVVALMCAPHHVARLPRLPQARPQIFGTSSATRISNGVISLRPDFRGRVQGPVLSGRSSVRCRHCSADVRYRASVSTVRQAWAISSAVTVVGFRVIASCSSASR